MTRQPVVGSIGVRAMLASFAALGLDAARIRRESGLDGVELEDPDLVLPAARLRAVWDAADRLWARPGLGLQAGQRAPMGACEVLDYLLLSSATLGDGLAQFAKYFAVAMRAATYEVVPRNADVLFALVWRVPPGGPLFQVRDFCLSAVAGRVAACGSCRPSRVELAGPALAPERDYVQVFGGDVALHASRDALAYRRDAWTARLSGSDEGLNRTLCRHAELLIERSRGAGADTLARKVRTEWLRGVRGGVPSIGEIASSLGMGPRTLQRQLGLEGTSYRALVEELRAGLAREYLGDRGLSIGEVAYLLGFSEPSAFTRAFRRWAGRSPQAFRAGGLPDLPLQDSTEDGSEG